MAEHRIVADRRSLHGFFSRELPPVLTVELPEGATVADLCGTVASEHPDLAAPLRSALPVVAGAHAEPGRQLLQGDEVALLTPVAGG